MNLLKLLLPLFLFSSQILTAQIVQLTEVGQLNNTLSEPSGIEFIYNPNNGHFEYWAHNDYENPDSIFSFRLSDPSTFVRVMDVTESFIDWEDMTVDDAGNIYLGDFGNWVGSDELQIVKTPNPYTFMGSPPNVDIIKFTFPVSGIADVEAMFHFDDHLYIFTKRVNSNNNPTLNENFTYCFRIPDTPSPMGSHEAVLVNEFQVTFPGDDPTTSRVTAADISPDKQTMALLCYERIWVFSCFENDAFFEGTVDSFNIVERQYEGVCFINNHEIVISKEGNIDNPDFNPKIFTGNLYPYIDGNCLDCEKAINGDFSRPDYGWTKFEYDSATANLEMNNGEAVLDIQTLGENLWHVNLRQKSMILEQGKTYRISYTAHAEDDRPISVIANKASGGMAYGYFAVDITTVPTQYVHEFTMEQETDFNSFLSFNVGRFFTHRVTFDDISLVEVECEDNIISSAFEVTEKEIVIYPNPARDQIYLELTDVENYSFQLFDLNGALLKEGQVTNEITLPKSSGSIFFLVLKNKIDHSKYVERVVRF